jgi:hypothetical protein
MKKLTSPNAHTVFGMEARTGDGEGDAVLFMIALIEAERG